MVKKMLSCLNYDNNIQLEVNITKRIDTFVVSICRRTIKNSRWNIELTRLNLKTFPCFPLSVIELYYWSLPLQQQS